MTYTASYPTTAGVNTWGNLTHQTTATTLEPWAVQRAFEQMSQEITQLRHEAWEMRRDLTFLRGAMDWLAKNPENTVDDYRKFLQVTNTIGEAIHGTGDIDKKQPGLTGYYTGPA